MLAVAAPTFAARATNTITGTDGPRFTITTSPGVNNATSVKAVGAPRRGR
jgi:hypothetical protein